MEKHATKWYTNESITKGKKFLNFQTEFKTEIWHKNIKISGIQIKIMNRILSGHDYSDYWLAKMKITQKGECKTCRISNTGWHLIFYGPKYNNSNNNNNNN